MTDLQVWIDHVSARLVHDPQRREAWPDWLQPENEPALAEALGRIFRR